MHCVTRAALVLALAVWEDVGVVDGDRIEHGAVVPVELVSRIAELGLTVVTQPRFIYERGDAYLGSVDADDREQLWRCGSLLAAGVRVAGSSDAPFGDADPWSAIASATSRQTRNGVVLGPDERLGSRAALDLYLAPLADPGGRVRRVEVGAPADLCVLDGSLADVLARPASSRVALTVARGVVTFRRTPR